MFASDTTNGSARWGSSEQAAHRCIRVLIVQPVVPHYRVPLFQGLSLTGGFDVRVLASATIGGFPASVKPPPPWADTNHEVLSIGHQLFWQRGLRLPNDFAAGDVLVINANPRFLSNVPLLIEARRRGVGVVSWGHGWSPTSKRWRAGLRYRYMEGVGDVILLYTDAEVRELKALRAWKIPLRATNNAVDESHFATAAAAWTKEDLAGFAVDNGVAGKDVLLFCGRLRAKPSTELQVAITALAHLRDRGDQYILAVVGSGDDEASLRCLSVELGVDHLIRWVGTQYAEKNLAPWFLTARCFVYPGAIGLSLLHAFGYGLPTITHDARHLHSAEIAALRDGENGMLFTKGDAMDLSRKIRQLCGNRDLRDRMAACARKTVESEYSMNAMIERFSSAIVLASEAARARSHSRRERSCYET